MIYRLFEVHDKYDDVEPVLARDFGSFLKYGHMQIVSRQWQKGKGGYHRVWRRGLETTKPDDWETRKKGGRESAVEIVGVHMPDALNILYMTEDQFLELYRDYRDSDLSWKGLHPQFGLYCGHVQSLNRDTGYEILYVRVDYLDA